MRILRGLNSRLLSCGCVAGVYETYDGAIVAMIDGKGALCADAAHRDGNVVPIDFPDVRNTSSAPPSTPGRQD